MKRTILCLGSFLVCAVPVYAFYSETSSALLFGNVAQVAGLVMAFLSYVRLSSCFARNHPLRNAALLLAFGVFIWLLGQCLEMYCELVLGLIAYGTVSDAVWVVGYFPIFAALHTILAKLRKERGLAGWKDARNFLSVSLGLYALLFYFFIWPQLLETNQPFGETILDFLYSTLDSVLLVQSLLIAKNSKPGSDFYAFAILTVIGVLVTFLGDAVLSMVKDFHSIVYLSVDVYYFTSYFLMALGADIEVKRRNQQNILSVGV